MNEEKSTRYHRQQRRLMVIGLAWDALLVAALIASGSHLLLRRAAERLVAPLVTPSPSSLLVVVACFVLFLLLREVGALPLAWRGGFVLERRYGLSTQSIGGWFADQLKSFVLAALLGSVGLVVVYGCIRWSAERWWIPAATLFAAAIVGLANVAPVLLLPLFYRVRPLDRAGLRTRLVALADRAGVPVIGVFELGLGEKTKKANAALAGLGGTRRILVSDTMLSSYSDEEIEVVLAHELAHHVHGDIWKGIAVETALLFVAAYVCARVLAAAAGPLRLTGPADAAGIPVLMLTGGIVSLLFMPAVHAMSRALERSADRFAIDLTHNPVAFVSAMRRLGAQNLAEDAPPRVVQWLFYSHPPIAERIAYAQRAPRS
jgi:STE24 endopeptidase